MMKLNQNTHPILNKILGFNFTKYFDKNQNFAYANPVRIRVTKNKNPLLAPETIHFQDIKNMHGLSVRHSVTSGAVFYYHNKKVVCNAEQTISFRRWQMAIFKFWVNSHRFIAKYYKQTN